MKITQKTVIYIVLGVVLLAVAFSIIDRLTGWTDSKRRAKFDAERQVSKQIIDKMRQDLAAENARADEAEQRAQKGEAKAQGLEAELDQFGARGDAAIKRQEEAVKNFDVQKTAIRNATDPCVLCRELCAEREKQSTADFDVRCAPDYCATICQP